MTLPVPLCCRIAAVAWLLMFALKRPNRVLLGNYILIVFHLVLLPVVSALPASEWVKAAGYIWIFIDTALGVAEINGLDEKDVWALRLGSHIPAAIWVAGSSVAMNRYGFTVGLLLAFALGVHALVAPFVPKWVLLPSVPLMVLWLIHVAH